ncbi:MAG: DUF58 domain-containing protein [Planctomycetia bacterium]|nr:DUF58 domain-containing protein [Planctomycetia bacterium]
MTTARLAESQLLDATTADRVRELELYALARVQGVLQGANASVLKGFTSDFLQHRQYHPGDNLKYLDWRVYARTDRLSIREYEELTNSQLTVVVDVSGSMRTGGSNRFTKHEFAVRVAAILLAVACQQHDQFSLALFRTGRIMQLPFRGGRSHLRRALAALVEGRADGGTDFVQGLAESTAHVRRRGLVVVLSDFMDEPETICRQLAALRHRHGDVIALQVFDPREADLDFTTITRFHDPESGDVFVVDPLLVRREYARAFAAHAEALGEGCRRHGFAHAMLPVDDDCVRPLVACLRARREADR